MLNTLIKFSLERRGLIIASTVLILAVSACQIPRMPIEVFPELNAPTVTIMTEAPGYAPEEVERAVTFPIETALNGIPGLRRLRSSSALGLSIVWVEFEFGADIYRNRQLVSERLDRTREELPENVHPPEMTPVASIAGEIMLLGLVSPTDAVSPLELRRLAEFDLRPRLLSVVGVAQVTALGGALPEYQVNVRPDDLTRYGLTLADVESAARAAHAPRGAGYLANVAGRELPLRPQTQASSAADIEGSVVGVWRGAPVTIGQVADVALAGAPPRGAGSANGKPAVILTVQRNPSANTLELTSRIDAVLDDFQKTLPLDAELEREIFRQANFITVAITNVLHALRDAGIFVVLILVLFLYNLRSVFITLMALPLSLGSALLILELWGVSINVMTLGGIAVAVGSLVDDAIVDVENVLRRLRQNFAKGEDARPVLRVVYEASIEVRQAIFLATIVIVLAFVPLFFLSGIEGRFFRPLGAAYMVSLGASLVVAMTVTPVLCYFLLGRNESRMKAGDTWVVRRLKTFYLTQLRTAMRFKVWVFGGSIALVTAALLLASTFGSTFLPDFNEGSVTVFLGMPAGTSLEESNRVALQIERRAGKIPGVASVTRRTGRAEKDEHAEPVSVSDLDVRLESDAEIAEVRQALLDVLEATPGVTAQLGGPIAHRLSHILSGTPAAIAIKVFGQDLDELRAIAREIEGELQSISGVQDLVANREVLSDTLPIYFDRARLAHYGLTPGEAASQVETAFLGRSVGLVNEGTSRIDIMVRLEENSRRQIDDVEQFVLRSPSGALVRLRDVAEIRQEPASNLITRENVRRKAVISCNVGEGHNLGDLVDTIRSRVDPIIARWPGTFVEYGGQFEAQEQASRRILWASLGVLALICAVLYAAFSSFRPVLLILINLPLALVGGVVALFISGSPDLWSNIVGLVSGGAYVAPVVSISSLVGFIGLAGVACRNGLLLVSHYYHLMEKEGVAKADAVYLGAEQRLVPILMTALSSALALVPLAFAKGEIGSELQHPIAVVILGGLVTSTLLNLIVIPVGFSIFGGGPRPVVEQRLKVAGVTEGIEE
ncbi:MAG: efflux RND transporter permease subunit [Myxococcota bacterium]|nr:efflux RND transporter permease subunit [Myxococcota bacterium]